jgi:hypothetical protein
VQETKAKTDSGTDTMVETTGKNRTLLWTGNKETYPVVIRFSVFIGIDKFPDILSMLEVQ